MWSRREAFPWQFYNPPTLHQAKIHPAMFSPKAGKYIQAEVTLPSSWRGGNWVEEKQLRTHMLGGKI